MLFPKKYDVFISYAVEDKSAIAEKLAKGLREKGIHAYYAGYELQVGDEIADQIYSGLEKSRYGIVILSPDYIRKWPEVERSQFLQRERRENDSLIFPVWHMITYEQVKTMYPELSDRYGLSTTQGVDNITENISTAIRKRKKKRMMKRLRYLALFGLVFFLLGVALSWWYRRYTFAHSLPSSKIVEFNVLKRIADYQEKLDLDVKQMVAEKNSARVTTQELSDTYDMFIRLNRHNRNTFSFTNDYFTCDTREKIMATGIPVNDAPYGFYRMDGPVVWQLSGMNETRRDTAFNFEFIIKNSVPTTFRIDTIFFSGKQAHARVTYANYMRMVRCKYNYQSYKEHVRHQEVRMSGFKPTEEYVFSASKANSEWTLAGIK